MAIHFVTPSSKRIAHLLTTVHTNYNEGLIPLSQLNHYVDIIEMIATETDLSLCELYMLP